MFIFTQNCLQTLELGSLICEFDPQETVHLVPRPASRIVIAVKMSKLGPAPPLAGHAMNHVRKSILARSILVSGFVMLDSVEPVLDLNRELVPVAKQVNHFILFARGNAKFIH